jgi:hypothetical protein
MKASSRSSESVTVLVAEAAEEVVAACPPVFSTHIFSSAVEGDER